MGQHMKNRFKDIMDIEDVDGVIFLGFDGKIIYSEFVSHPPEHLADTDWHLFIHSLNGLREAQFIFENRKFYIRRAEIGLIIVLMNTIAQTEMVRLNCDILISSLEEKEEKPKGLRRFFKF
jgi:hypothetical protein